LKLIDHVPEDDLSLSGDSDGLIRLFVNLLNNAIKYTEQGAITLSAEPQADKWLAVTIDDTGVGIAPEHLPRIFDRFYRVENTSKNYSGIGLGLYISSEIIKRHNGQIGVNSTLGEGSTFWFTV